SSEERALTEASNRVAKPATIVEFDGELSMVRGTLWNEMVSLAGLVNAAEGLEADRYGFAPLSREMLFKLDPDWLALSASTAQSMTSDPLSSGLKAVRQRHLLVLSVAMTTSTSQAALEAARMLQRAAYPNLR